MESDGSSSPFDVEDSISSIGSSSSSSCCSSSSSEDEDDRLSLSTENGGKDNNGSTSNSSEEVEEDRLSSLPDSLLVEILSLLPIEYAVATSVLSQRYRHLWTQLTCLTFSCYDSTPSSPLWRRFDRPAKLPKLCTIIDRIFRHLTSTKLRTFRLELKFTPAKQRESCTSSLQSWIRQICHQNVEEIEVCPLNDSFGRRIPLPSCVFETHSLVELKLTGRFDYNLPDNGIISLPNLKKLSLHLRDSDRELMRLLFKSCPLLEDLDLGLDGRVRDEDDHLVDISSQNLKQLTINIGGGIKGSRLRIDAPRLEDFKLYTSRLPSHCFVKDLNCLLQAVILVDWESDDPSYTLNEISILVHGISGARSLFLSCFLVNSLNHLHEAALPIFRNLTQLKLFLVDPHGWNALLHFLGCSPNLEVLVVWHDDEFECDTNNMDWATPNDVPACLLNTLKRMEIERLQGSQKELDFLGYFLSNGNVLERLLLSEFNHLGQGKRCKELKFCENLFSCPRSSEACEIEVFGEFLSASTSKGFTATVDRRYNRTNN